MPEQTLSPLLQRIERYYDAVPRRVCDVEELGPFTLFASRGGWPFYARPSHAVSSRRADERFTADDVLRVRSRQSALDLPQTFEWMVDAAPGLATACRDAGLEVVEYPLLVHRRPTAVPVPDGIRIRRLGPDDPAVAAGQVVASLGFGSSRTAVGEVGPAERDAALDARDPAASDQLRGLMRDGRSVYVVAEDEHGVVCSGAHNPVDDVTEIVGVATLPSHRRRGLAAAVTDTLVADAMRRDVDVIFLTADSDAVARVYERVGFERVATSAAAEPPSS